LAQLLPAAKPQLLPAAQAQLLPAASIPRITDRAAAAGSVAPGEGVARPPTDVASMLQQTRAGLQTALKEITSCRNLKQQCTRDLASCEASSAHTGKELQAELTLPLALALALALAPTLALALALTPGLTCRRSTPRSVHCTPRTSAASPSCRRHG
jgi:hypothetical protein